MIENALEILSEHLFTTVTGKIGSAKGLLVKKHSENLQTHGDFSLPNSVKSLHGYLAQNEHTTNGDVTLLQCIGKSPKTLVEQSSHWNLPLKSVKEDTARVYLFLDRPLAIAVGFSEAMRNNMLISQLLENKTFSVKIDPLSEEANGITSMRINYLSKVIENLCTIHGKYPDVMVTSRSTCDSSGSRLILCGSVLNIFTGAKETSIGSDMFIRIRQNEMTLIARHKYGVRVTTDSKWKEFLTHLGESAVAFELLQSKPSSPTKVNFNSFSAGSSKGVSFVLYNCARLETIIKAYNEKVEEGIYPVLPNLEDIDLRLLTPEDEWNLLFNYVLGFPTMLAQCVEVTEQSCEFRPHHICAFLSSMVRVFSQYYRNTRILVEPRTHLLPTICARIHMLKILNDTLKTCLKILNIKSVSQM